MSGVPPNSIGSVLQSHLTRRTVSNVRDTERNQAASATNRQNQAIDEKDTTIDTGDDNTRISPDAQGSGGQGRAFSSPDEENPEEIEALDDEQQGDTPHIDIEA
jgi:hypothetical protein